MSGRADDELNIESVTVPPAPPDAPDDFTRAEQGYIDQLASMPPQRRNVHLYERQAAAIEADRQRLLAEVAACRRTLDGLRPAYASLDQACGDMRGVLGIATLAMTIGGVLISIAGAISDETWKPKSLWGGIGLSACGLLASLHGLFFIRTKQRFDPD